MDKTFYQIVDDCIVKNIPSSVKINETIYDYQKIADIYIDGKLIMRTEISEISHVDNFFHEYRNYSEWNMNLMSVWGLNIIQDMVWSTQKTSNSKYVLFAKDIFKKFIQIIHSEDDLLERTIAATFNRTIILINLYHFLLEKDDTLAEDILNFLTHKQIAVLESTQMTNASIFCSKLLIYKVAGDAKHIDETIVEMKAFIHSYINEDGSSKDYRLLSNSYFNRFFSLFMDLLKDDQIKDDALAEIYKKNITYLRTMTTQEGFFPSLNGFNGGKSPFESLVKTQYFENSGYFVNKNEDIFFLQNACKSKSVSSNLCGVVLTYGKKDIFLESAIVEEHVVYTKPYFIDGHSLNRIIDFASNSNVDVKFINSNTIIDVSSKVGHMCLSSKWKELDNSIIIHCSATSKYGGLKYFFILSSQCHDVKLYKDCIKFFAGGFLPVSMRIQSDLEYQITLAYGIGDEKGNKQKVQIIEILCEDKNTVFNIEITFDKAKYDEYKRNTCTFLPEKAKQQIETAINSDIFTKMTQYGNIGATEIYRMGRQAYLEHNFEFSKKCEILNSILRNCIVKSSCEIGEGSKFAYGGGWFTDSCKKYYWKVLHDWFWSYACQWTNNWRLCVYFTRSANCQKSLYWKFLYNWCKRCSQQGS